MQNNKHTHTKHNGVCFIYYRVVEIAEGRGCRCDPLDNTIGGQLCRRFSPRLGHLFISALLVLKLLSKAVLIIVEICLTDGGEASALFFFYSIIVLVVHVAAGCFSFNRPARIFGAYYVVPYIIIKASQCWDGGNPVDCIDHLIGDDCI